MKQRPADSAGRCFRVRRPLPSSSLDGRYKGEWLYHATSHSTIHEQEV